MSTQTAVPITITSEASERIQRLGLQAAFDRMIEYALQVVPGIRSIHVYVTLPYDMGYDLIDIEATVPNAATVDDFPSTAAWDRWQLSTFPPEVYSQFLLSVNQEAPL